MTEQPENATETGEPSEDEQALADEQAAYAAGQDVTDDPNAVQNSQPAGDGATAAVEDSPVQVDQQ
jgi:hypothetical protein